MARRGWRRSSIPPHDSDDMIYAKTAREIETRRKSLLRRWRLKCRAVADGLEEVGDWLFTFTRLPESQWQSARTTNAIVTLSLIVSASACGLEARSHRTPSRKPA